MTPTRRETSRDAAALTISRRAMLAGLAAAAAGPMAAAQQPRKWRVGFLTLGAEGSPLVDSRVKAFRDGLGPDPADIEVVERRAGGRVESLSPMAADLVSRQVQAICAIAPPAVRAAQQASSGMPVIALDLESDPVASGWAASLARPGGHVTGIFLDIPEFNAKTLQLLNEIVPDRGKVAVLWHPASGSLQLDAMRRAAASLGTPLEVIGIDGPAAFEEAFAAAGRSQAKGAVMLSSSLFAGNLDLLAGLALRQRLPTINTFPEFAAGGGLIGYGPDLPSLFTQAGYLTRRVLQGMAIADLPIERPTRFQLAVNLKTAGALNLTLPTSVLLSADTVIE